MGNTSTTGDIVWRHVDPKTWELSNTPSADTVPIPDTSPAAGVQDEALSATGKAASDQEIMQQMYAAQGLSPQGFKLKPSVDERRAMRHIVKGLLSGEEQRDWVKDSQAEYLLGNKLAVIDDQGVSSAFAHMPGGERGKQEFVRLMEEFRDRTDNRLGEQGLDTSKMSTQEILDALQKGREQDMEVRYPSGTYQKQQQDMMEMAGRMAGGQ